MKLWENYASHALMRALHISRGEKKLARMHNRRYKIGKIWFPIKSYIEANPKVSTVWVAMTATIVSFLSLIVAVIALSTR